MRLQTRNGNDWTRKFPSISDSVAQLKAKSAVVDMEAVAFWITRAKALSGLARRLSVREGDRQSIQAYIFDLLYLDGKDLAGEPLTSRKRRSRIF